MSITGELGVGEVIHQHISIQLLLEIGVTSQFQGQSTNQGGVADLVERRLSERNKTSDFSFLITKGKQFIMCDFYT